MKETGQGASLYSLLRPWHFRCSSDGTFCDLASYLRQGFRSGNGRSFPVTGGGTGRTNFDLNDTGNFRGPGALTCLLRTPVAFRNGKRQAQCSHCDHQPD